MLVSSCRNVVLQMSWKQEALYCNIYFVTVFCELSDVAEFLSSIFNFGKMCRRRVNALYFGNQSLGLIETLLFLNISMEIALPDAV